MSTNLTGIDFLKIHPIGGDQRFAFEELCCQLASDEPSASRVSFYRKGSGGDAGVECYATLDNGDEIGWQAKYFPTFGASQVANLTESIENALVKHPSLTRYIVCLPINLKDSRAVGRGGKTVKTELMRWQEWKQTRLDAVEVGRKLSIELWDASALLARLTADDSKTAGRRAFFFGDLHLTPDWFREQFQRTKAKLQQRYTPDLDVELPIRRVFWGLARTGDLYDIQREFGGRLVGWDWVRQPQPEVITTELQSAIDEGVRRLASTLAMRTSAPNVLPIETWRSLCDSLMERIREAVRCCQDAPSESSTDAYEHRVRLRQLADILVEFQAELDGEAFKFANCQAALVSGPAGTGKSHLLADAAESAIARGHPAVMLLTSSFVEGEIGPQVLAQLDKRRFDFSDFLGAMNAAGQASGVRALVIIDALNEGYGISLWRARLSGFCTEISRFPHVAVCFSCRSTYLESLLPPTPQTEFVLPAVEHDGFSSLGGRATRQYLAKRGIAPLGGPTSLTEFSNPLFLKACCDSLLKQGKSAFPAGSHSLSELFDIYLSFARRSVEDRMGLDHRLRIAQRGLEALTQEMRRQNRPSLDLHEALAVFDGVYPSNGQTDKSLLFQLEAEGVLTVESEYRGTSATPAPIVRYTFERISDLQLAEGILRQQIAQDADMGEPPVGSALHDLLTSPDLFARAGVLEALAILLPERHGIEILDVECQDVQSDWVLLDAFSSSLLLRNQRSFSDRTKELTDEHGATHSLQVHISIATEPDNKFNARWLHESLWADPMAVRDARWSYLLATADMRDGAAIAALIDWAWDAGPDTKIEADRAELAGITLTWILSTPNRAVRDRATKALSALLRPRLELAQSLLARFANVNDLYILERLLGAVYGAVLHSGDYRGLSALAGSVFDSFFDAESPPPHLLIRDYAAGIVAYFLARSREGVPVEREWSKAAPPWQSNLGLRFVEDSELDVYKISKPQFGQPFDDAITRSSKSEWTGDFAKYVIAPAVNSWWAIPIAEPDDLTCEELCRRWTLTLNPIDHADLLAALGHIYTFVTQLRGDEDESQRPPGGASSGKLTFRVRVVAADRDSIQREQQEFDALERAVLSHMSSANRLNYFLFIRPFLFEQRRGRESRPPDIPAELCQRWVAIRAHEFGWTSELLGDIDDDLGRRSDRQVNPSERVGKKYQWLALHELLAELSDNMRYAARYSDSDSQFEGAWQTNRRDIDPSLSINRTKADTGYGPTWWSPVSPRLDEISLSEQEAWLRTEDDLLDGDKQIDVADNDGKHWLTLHGFVSFSTAHSSSSHVDTWCRIWCMVVRKENLETTVASLARRILIDPRALPEREVSEVFLAEFPWHASLNRSDGWQPAFAYEVGPKVLPASASYLCESGGYDYSVESSVRLGLPERWLINRLNLRFSDTDGFSAVDGSGRTVFLDPSVTERGPSAALMAKDVFLEVLEREGLAPIWVVAGEKGAYGSGSDDFVGRYVHSSVYTVNANGNVTLARKRKVQRERGHK